MTASPHEQLHDRIRAEFREMPGMRLKLEQVQRLCGIERMECQIALDALVKAEFLCKSSDGHYARPRDGEPSRRDVAQVYLASERRFLWAS